MRAERKKLDRGNTLFLLFVAGVLFLLGHPIGALCQAQLRHQAAIIGVEVVKVTPNPDDSQDSKVTVKIEIRATAKQLVVPDCSETNSDEHFFCGGNARLVRFNGKSWRNAKPVFGVVMGMDPIEHWKPIILAPGSQATCLFRFSSKLFGIRKDEGLKVGFEVWSDPENMQYNNAFATLLTPIFKVPSN
jgi:hypothetical protein